MSTKRIRRLGQIKNKAHGVIDGSEYIHKDQTRAYIILAKRILLRYNDNIHEEAESCSAMRLLKEQFEDKFKEIL